jgi:hypothetical protein
MMRRPRPWSVDGRVGGNSWGRSGSFHEAGLNQQRESTLLTLLERVGLSFPLNDIREAHRIHAEIRFQDGQGVHM